MVSLVPSFLSYSADSPFVCRSRCLILSLHDSFSSWLVLTLFLFVLSDTDSLSALSVSYWLSFSFFFLSLTLFVVSNPVSALVCSGAMPTNVLQFTKLTTEYQSAARWLRQSKPAAVSLPDPVTTQQLHSLRAECDATAAQIETACQNEQTAADRIKTLELQLLQQRQHDEASSSSELAMSERIKTLEKQLVTEQRQNKLLASHQQRQSSGASSSPQGASPAKPMASSPKSPLGGRVTAIRELLLGTVCAAACLLLL